MNKSLRSFCAVIFSFLLFVSPINLGPILKINAAEGQYGVEQITLNPGGGAAVDGSDGIRFTLNAAQESNYGQMNYSPVDGADAVAFMGTHQYCCSAGGPMLNIGGILYGQAGPAHSEGDWSSIELISTSGVASVGARTNATGNSGATLRYTVIQDELTYIMERTVSYIFPNDFVLDSYTFTIPTGNTDVVKFYLGGDTAPGSSDSGYGIMLTSPVLSVISLNTSSQIMFGLREVQGSKPFDGATSQSFYNPYATVNSGGDIGFIGEATNHDAGLMVQWNLGSTPGTYNASMHQFVTQQGTNLSASLQSSYAATSVPVDLNISIVNSELDPISGLGYTITLPTDLLIANTATSNCGGSLTATVSTGVISISGVNLNATSNCVVTVPVVSDVDGQYVIDANSVSGLAGGLVNNVGTSQLNVGVYTLSFATQGGSLVDDVIALVNQVIAMPAAPTRNGYTFLNWNTAANGIGTVYNPTANFTMPGANTTIYAIWEAIPTYTITFDEKGGSDVSNLNNEYVGAGVTLPTASTRTGFTFIGWNTADSGLGTTYLAEAAYTVPANNVILYAMWDDNDGIAYASERAGPNNGDANDDGTTDSEQIYVASFSSIVNGERVVVETPNTCELSLVSSGSEQSGVNQDSGYSYAGGLLNFTAECAGAPGLSIEVKLYFYGMSLEDSILRKYNPNTNAYFTIESAVLENVVIDGENVVVATYEITDGGELDIDGLEDGIIIDPVGLGAQSLGAPNTGFGGLKRQI